MKKILTGKFSGRCMSDNWCDNSEHGTEFHDTSKLMILVVDLNKPRKDYSFHWKSGHSYIQTYHQMSPFDDASFSKVTEWNNMVDLLRCTRGIMMLSTAPLPLYYITPLLTSCLTNLPFYWRLQSEAVHEEYQGFELIKILAICRFLPGQSLTHMRWLSRNHWNV